MLAIRKHYLASARVRNGGSVILVTDNENEND